MRAGADSLVIVGAAGALVEPQVGGIQKGEREDKEPHPPLPAAARVYTTGKRRHGQVRNLLQSPHAPRCLRHLRAFLLPATAMLVVGRVVARKQRGGHAVVSRRRRPVP